MKLLKRLFRRFFPPKSGDYAMNLKFTDTMYIKYRIMEDKLIITEYLGGIPERKSEIHMVDEYPGLVRMVRRLGDPV